MTSAPFASDICDLVAETNKFMCISDDVRLFLSSNNKDGLLAYLESHKTAIESGKYALGNALKKVKIPSDVMSVDFAVFAYCVESMRSQATLFDSLLESLKTSPASQD